MSNLRELMQEWSYGFAADAEAPAGSLFKASTTMPGVKTSGSSVGLLPLDA
jgi:hypothetical protein